MSTEQKQKRDELAKLLSGHTQLASLYSNQPSHYLAVADYLLNNGVDVELPPEPQWTPGQYVMLTLGEARQVAERNAQNTGWFVIANSTTFTDAEVTDVESAVVFTAEDADGVADDLRMRVAHSSGARAGATAQNMLSLIFAERGVDVR